MSVATEITRIQTDRNTIRNKLIDFGLVESSANLDACATAIDGIVNQGAVSATVQEGDTYTIPKGYHNGSGTVSGVAGGGSYNLQSKSVTPTKQQQSITPDSGYYGLSDVTVGAIPQAYQDVSSVTATAADVLAGKVFVTSSGAVTTGEMANNGAVNKTLTAQEQNYTIPKGYHSGTGSVSISPESKTATPTKSQQTISPTAGKVLTSVIVEAIPSQYVDTSDATATAAQILDGATAYVDGELVEGTMPNNGAVTETLDAATTSYTVPAGYHSGTGKVSVSLETKSATPTKSPQTISPSTGKLLSSVSVAAIPEAYQDVTSVTAVAADVLTGKVIVSATGEEINGTMPNNGATSLELDGMQTTTVSVPAGYTSGGSVTLTNSIETALAAI